MRCSACGAEIADYALYCPKCGVQTASAKIQSCVVNIGREPDNDIIIPNDHVSRHHARASLESGACVLEDLGSLNGVYVNGFKIQIERIQPGDEIMLGRHARLHYDQIVSTARNKGYGALDLLTTGIAPTPEVPSIRPAQIPSPPAQDKPADRTLPAEDTIGVGQWLVYLLLCMIPVLNLVLLANWSRDHDRPSFAAWAGTFFWFVVAALAVEAVSVIFFILSLS